jgi:hypothetical protein
MRVTWITAKQACFSVIHVNQRVVKRKFGDIPPYAVGYPPTAG